MSKPSFTKQKKYNCYYLAAVVRIAQSHGIDIKDLLAGSGLSEEDLHSSERKVSMDQIVRVFLNAKLGFNKDQFGLILGQELCEQDLGMLSLAGLASSDFSEKARLISQYSHIAGTIIDLEWQDYGDSQGLCFIEPLPLGELFVDLVESHTLFTVSYIRRRYGEQFNPDAIHFSYNPPCYAEIYEDIFKCPIEFNASRCEVVYDFRYFTSMNAPNNPVNQDWVLRQFESQPLADDFEKTAYRLIYRDFQLDLESLGRELNVAPRTLRRRFSEAGTSFQKLKNTARIEKAKELLENTNKTVEQISDLTGFKSYRRFRGFFHEQAGMSALEYRKTALMDLDRK